MEGMGGVGATIPPLRGPTRHKTARKRKSGRFGRDDKTGKGKPNSQAQNRRVGHPARCAAIGRPRERRKLTQSSQRSQRSQRREAQEERDSSLRGLRSE